METSIYVKLAQAQSANNHVEFDENEAVIAGAFPENAISEGDAAAATEEQK